MNYIALFKPPTFNKKRLAKNDLEHFWGKKLYYSSRGRNSLFHILSALMIKRKILLPIYICETVVEPCTKLNLDIVYYDLNLNDLNANIESIKKKLDEYPDIEAILVASMYGNPAELPEIEKLCKDRKVYMIDDAAQSFGAEINGRKVGTFGDAGFFSFSPGKPLAGHLGSFFWVNKDYNIKYKNNPLYDRLVYLDFYYRRLNTYKYKKNILVKILSRLVIILDRFIDTKNYYYSLNDSKIMGGIFYSYLNGDFNFRMEYFSYFYSNFNDNNLFSIVRGTNGTSNYHKIVIIFKSKIVCNFFLQRLNKNNIAYINGYNLLDTSKKLENALSLDGKIVELPIERDTARMDYLFKIIRDFIEEQNIGN